MLKKNSWGEYMRVEQTLSSYFIIVNCIFVYIAEKDTLPRHAEIVKARNINSW
ncbi:hypothetical protein AN944_00346 [Shewanella sp. P1-14-1]|nr:hypothetical protein AN944_00346 [Shewanella sp. P1-14-1]